MSRARMATARLIGVAAGELAAACRGCCTGQALRAAYDSIVEEEVPEPLRRTLDSLGREARQ